MFRSVKATPDVAEIKFPRNTMRPPGNVPYIVDNLWEWKRPKDYPSRRRSVFASPKKALALESGRENGTVYKIEFAGNFKLCQLVEYTDSKYHPECKNLKNLINKKISDIYPGWFDEKLSEKESFGPLWMPCLTKDDINFLFGKNEKLRNIRDEIYAKIKYWDDVVLIKKDLSLENDTGELFFEARNGYYLRDIG